MIDTVIFAEHYTITDTHYPNLIRGYPFVVRQYEFQLDGGGVFRLRVHVDDECMLVPLQTTVKRNEPEDLARQAVNVELMK